jgi:steroid delta-isomerase-like uncharacterized protein
MARPQTCSPWNGCRNASITLDHVTDNAQQLVEFMEAVWNAGDVAAADRFLAEQYTIHSDPGDAWDGQTLSREGFKNRLVTSRAPFPDLRFELGDLVAEGDRVAVSWIMRGTQLGALGGLPPSGRTIAVRGMTIYYFTDGRIAGHRQIVDRLAVAQQLGLLG